MCKLRYSYEHASILLFMQTVYFIHGKRRGAKEIKWSAVKSSSADESWSFDLSRCILAACMLYTIHVSDICCDMMYAVPNINIWVCISNAFHPNRIFRDVFFSLAAWSNHILTRTSECTLAHFYCLACEIRWWNKLCQKS